MARLADDYKNFPQRNVETSKNDAPEIWVTAKPYQQPLIRRIQDAWYVITGKYDAVYYHEDIKDNK